jgi:hypothetical protein
MKPKDLGYPHELWTQRLLTEALPSSLKSLLFLKLKLKIIILLKIYFIAF